MTCSLLVDSTLDKNLCIKLYHLSTSSYSFQRPPGLIWFEFHESVPEKKIISLARLSSSNNPIVAGIPSVFLIRLMRKDLHITNLNIRLKAGNGSSISSISNPMSQEIDVESFEIPKIPGKRGFVSTFLYTPIREGSERILVSGDYLIDTKSIHFESFIELDISPPFVVTYKTAPVHSEGVLLQVSLLNNSRYTLHNVRLEIATTSQYHVEEKEVLVTKCSLPLSQHSSVFGLELMPGGLGQTNALGTLTVRWAYGSNDNCEMKINKTVLVKQSAQTSNCVSISMIGSPQIQKVLNPFTVKLDIHNTSSITRDFAIKVLSDQNDKLLPYELNSIHINDLNPNESQRIDMKFIGLRQGLLPYPDFLVTSSPNIIDMKICSENGVLITAE